MCRKRCFVLVIWSRRQLIIGSSGTTRLNMWRCRRGDAMTLDFVWLLLPQRCGVARVIFTEPLQEDADNSAYCHSDISRKENCQNVARRRPSYCTLTATLFNMRLITLIPANLCLAHPTHNRKLQHQPRQTRRNPNQ